MMPSQLNSIATKDYLQPHLRRTKTEQNLSKNTILLATTVEPPSVANHHYWGDLNTYFAVCNVQIAQVC